jgi:GT2 family glycosyltransferase
MSSSGTTPQPVAPEARATGDSLSVVIVCWNDGEALERTLPDLVRELAAPRPGFADAIRRPATDGRGWGAWMGLVTAEEGRVVNSTGGIVHFTGIAWAGGAGNPVPETIEAGEVAFVSGACLVVPTDSWKRLGGFPAEYFLYHEDVDVSMRLRLAGEKLGIEPAAIVDHDYEFHRRGQKMYLLERNRWSTVLRTYPGPVLAVTMPGLLLTEMALWPVSIAGGWWRLKLAANRDLLRSLPRLLRERRAIQRDRKVSSREFAAHLSADLDSAYLGRAARLAPLRWALRAYWGAARGLLRLLSFRSS